MMEQMCRGNIAQYYFVCCIDNLQHTALTDTIGMDLAVLILKIRCMCSNVTVWQHLISVNNKVLVYKTFQI
jgi:hypothetical protein